MMCFIRQLIAYKIQAPSLTPFAPAEPFQQAVQNVANYNAPYPNPVPINNAPYVFLSSTRRLFHKLS